MTLIVGKFPDLIADRKVAIKIRPAKNFFMNEFKDDAKVIITEDQEFAYVFSNDQFPEVVPVVTQWIRAYELKKMPKDLELIPGPKGMIIVVLTRRALYHIVTSKEGHLKFSLVEGDSSFISPNGQYSIYNMLSLTAKEIFDVTRRHSLACINSYYDLVTAKDLKLIKGSKK